jgi:hypothetical protein
VVPFSTTISILIHLNGKNSMSSLPFLKLSWAMIRLYLLKGKLKIFLFHHMTQ